MHKQMIYQSLNLYCTRLALLSGIKNLVNRNVGIKEMFDRKILKIILDFGMFSVVTERIQSENVSKSGLGYTVIILEYLKRLKEGRYLVFPEMAEDYKKIISCMECSIQEIPFRKDEYLIHIIFGYIHDVDYRFGYLITPKNIFYIRKILNVFVQDTESFLNAIFYLFRYPNWKQNHIFIVDYMLSMLSSTRNHYYFE